MASYLCFKSSDRPPTQGPHHYSEINSKVNLPKVVFRKAPAVDFRSRFLPFTPFVPVAQCAIGGKSARCH
ncbi:Uncharacterized protein ALO83_04529 [Pseudomonas cannabina pv. alisalensis]|uniref:Uncharacterized protein n=1 Tax=Pseudomonas cannabina TaxID=86840 RepID=A0AB37Q7I1_PSECA|nr:Uncharacterized protein AC507_1455 [Pseudomonas syringae pv. maculicola]KPW21960.1 Uncharacterized protein ALO83_04529 [Pseudomonas cannabina pv. alisalensis]RMN79816.1 hypothetical protein ALQ53_04601 [Pseudomonas cannabina]